MQERLSIERPKRWDHPLDAEMEASAISWLCSQPPFSQMDSTRFPPSASLPDILRNDTRIARYEPGDIVIREGDYGSSAFLVLTGRVRVLLTRIAPASLGRSSERKSSWWKALRDSWKSWNVPEQRNVARVVGGDHQNVTAMREIDQRPRVYLQDVQTVLKGCESETLGSGEIFGELAAMTRSANTFTVIAEEPCILLEIRWQGLRLLRRDSKFKEYLDVRYRANSLSTHLRETELLRYLPEEKLDLLTSSTELLSFGEMEWFAEYEETRKKDVREQVISEPLIVEEGAPVTHLILIRAGFARLSHRQGDGHRTVSYLGKGQIFGFQELAHNFRIKGIDEPLPYQESLRAVGFVDILRIPKQVVYEHVLPFVRTSELPKTIRSPRYDSLGRPVPEAQLVGSSDHSKTALLEFLVDKRLINGRQSMIIDLEKCTRCDDCVKACSSTHEGNPRFVRSGERFGPWMFTHACMHCEDPVCMIGCPTGAIGRNQDTGVISINAETCIGCKTCSESCPYGNITMVEIRDEAGRLIVDQQSQAPIMQATKCDLCQNLPSGPACLTACPHDALVRIDMSNLRQLGDWMERKVA